MRVPLFFEHEGHVVAGWLHRPAEPSGHGVVLVPPFGYEAICAHRSLRALADAFAAAGVVALRIDPAGTGDSSGSDADADRIGAWTASVRGAAKLVREHASRVDLVGVRLGALLATLAADAADGIVAIAPVVSGRAYVRELAMVQSALDLPPSALRDGDREALGFRLTAETAAQLSKIDLLKRPPPNGDVFVVDRDDLPSGDAWIEKLGCRSMRVPGYVEMMLDPHKAIVPSAIVRAVVDAVRQRRVEPRSSASGAPANEATIDGIRERALFADDHVFGVLSFPEQPTGKGIVLVNAGAIHHIGPNRLHVTAARRWAREGHLVYRIDLSGLGESPARPGAPEPDVYPIDAVRDVIAAVDRVRAFGARDVLVVGLCSGAFHAQKAAFADPSIRGFVAINPLTFVRPEGEVDFPSARAAREAERYKRSMRDPEKWKKLLRGDVAFRVIAKTFGLRFGARAADIARAIARRVGRPFANDVAAELEKMAARGQAIRFVLADGDPGQMLLRQKAGGLDLAMTVLRGADHTFTGVGTHEPLLDALTRAIT
jgi:alpha-beta hydrolase superfamily lysophospholipase